MNLPENLKNRIAEITCTAIPNAECRYEFVPVGERMTELRITAELSEETAVGDWHVSFTPAFQPDFWYTPHLTPTAEHVVDMHVFRTPALMMGKGDYVLCLMPVLDGYTSFENRIYMDLDAPGNVMTFGITTTKMQEHSLYVRTDHAVLPKGTFTFAVRIFEICGEEAKNPFRPVLAYYWNRYGHSQSDRLAPLNGLMQYVKHTYRWAFENWKDSVWQEFDLDGKRVGAPQMIVITKQSPNYHKPYSIREPVAIWNQAWFCSMRSACGLYRYGKETGNEDYIRKACMTKELALSFPQEDGLFDAVIGVPTEEYEVDGKKYYRGADWSKKFFGNSNRNPQTWELMNSPRHILDMSWTALFMLQWYEELEKDERLLAYVTRYADRLITMADADGFFPAWLEKGTGRVLPELAQSPESAVSVTLLMRLYRLSGRDDYRKAALRCMDALIRNVMPDSRWEDFETYWSCSRFGGDMQGKKYERNAAHKQCSLSPFFMAEALLTCWEVTGEKTYLTSGERCLDEMLMFQNSLQPDYIPITVVGGFGVMNGDCELNDARQSMFAELICRYGKACSRPEYLERGCAALRASFSMMYCPENPLAKEQWEMAWPFLNETDYGFMMENYGHGGYANSTSLGIGEFTIYDWGNGAASEAVMRTRAHHPELFEG